MPVKTMAAVGKVARVFFALALLVAVGIARAELAGPVVAVLDGDTIDVLIDRQPVRVRLAHSGKNINAAMVEQGMAWVYRQYAKDRVLLALEEDARKHGRGLWVDANPIPPWEYRRPKAAASGATSHRGPGVDSIRF